jgi:hypothetical protein
MPANTAKGYPYPLGTDRVMDGDDAIKNLATAVDSKLPAKTYVTDGTVSISANVAANATITFPAGRFTVAPRVTVNVVGSSVYIPYVNSVAATSVNLGARHYKDLSQSISLTVHVIALQMLASAADG